jgi:hypothetical protein
MPNKTVSQDKLSGFVDKLHQHTHAAGSQLNSIEMTTIRQHHKTMNTATTAKPMNTQDALLPPEPKLRARLIQSQFGRHHIDKLSNPYALAASEVRSASVSTMKLAVLVELCAAQLGHFTAGACCQRVCRW